ncbi:hypothetical protein AUTU_02940 [Aureibacter tunicatorum]|nr:hypothetical protein AUTU_02940 [Aureibacter tunicatorum]
MILAIVCLQPAFSQAGWNWPEDKELAMEKNVLYTDLLKQKKYEQARAPLTWLLNNAPDLNKSLYINGEKIYEALALKEKDPSLRQNYVDSTMLMFDMRIKYFGEKNEVIERKALTAYKLEKGNKAAYKDLYELLGESVDLNGNDTFESNLVAYMDVTRRYKKSGGDISDDQVLAVYDKISDIFAYKLDHGGNEDRIGKYQENVDKLLAATINVDCDFIENKLGPKLQENPEDLGVATNIFKLSIVGKCFDLPVFVQSAEVVYNSKPTYGLAKLIATRLVDQKKYTEALDYYQKAIELTEENTKKAEMNLQIAVMMNRQGNKSSARSYALKATQEDPSLSEAYSFVGNLYMNSYNSCKGGQDKALDRAIFILAYDMFSKAGNRKGMAAAKAQFPSAEEIFTYNHSVGETVHVGCWVNRDVVLQKRD